MLAQVSTDAFLLRVITILLQLMRFHTVQLSYEVSTVFSSLTESWISHGQTPKGCVLYLTRQSDQS